MPLTVRMEDPKGLNPMMAFLDPKLYRKAVNDGLRYAGRAGKTTIAKEVGQRYTLKASRIKDDIKGPYADPNAGAIEFRFSTKPPTAVSYGATQTRAGLRVAFKRGKRTTFRKGFIAQGVSFERTGSTRLPIEPIYGPSIGRIVVGRQAEYGRQIQQATLARTSEQFIKGVERALAAQARRK